VDLDGSGGDRPRLAAGAVGGHDARAGDLAVDPPQRAARLLADGAWFNTALGIPTVRDDERSVLRAIALQLVNEGDPQ